MKINDLTFFLSKYKELETKNCFQIDIEDKKIKIRDIDKEYPLILLPDAINTIFKSIKHLEGLINCLKEFSQLSLYINYPSLQFDNIFKVFRENMHQIFRNDHTKIIVFITGFETDDHFKTNQFVENVRFDSTVVKIGPHSFSECKSLGNAFDKCSLLKEIIIPPSVIFIGDNAFSKCSLKKVSIPSSVIKMGSDAFANCLSLEEVSFSESMKEIPSCTFSGCVSLKKFEIPKSVKSINYNAFYGCSSLKEVIVPSSLDVIYGGAILDCNSLKQVTIPSKTQINKKTIFFFSSEVFSNSTKVIYK